jgi:hypothetical protein
MYDVNGWADSLRFNYYRTPALIPPMDWIDTIAPKPPRITKISVDKNNKEEWLTVTGDDYNKDETETIKSFVAYVSSSLVGLTNHPAIIIPADNNLDFKFLLPFDLLNDEWNNCFVTVTSVDRQNNESQASNIITLQRNDNGWQVKK